MLFGSGDPAGVQHAADVGDCDDVFCCIHFPVTSACQLANLVTATPLSMLWTLDHAAATPLNHVAACVARLSTEEVGREGPIERI
jgi:hypothetical protein